MGCISKSLDRQDMEDVAALVFIFFIAIRISSADRWTLECRAIIFFSSRFTRLSESEFEILIKSV